MTTSSSPQAKALSATHSPGAYRPSGSDALDALTSQAPATVNDRFTAKRRTRPKPTEEWVKFMGRLFRAFTRRAADEDPWVLADMMAMQDQLAQQIDAVGADLVARYGSTVVAQELAAAGRTMTKQNVGQRWGKATRKRTQGSAA